MRKILLIIGVVLFLLLAFIGYKISIISADPVHYHANFAVFVDGSQVDFTKPELMHIKPCTDADEFSTDPRENVHLHDEIGNVVHVHAENISWNLFFSTVKFDVKKASAAKVLSLYSKGKKIPSDVLSQTIQKEDELLVHIASESGAENITDSSELQKEQGAVGTNANEYDNGKMGTEKCGVAGKRTLFERFKLAFRL